MSRTARNHHSVLTLLLAAVSVCIASNTYAQDKTTFDDHVKAILRTRCASCHGPDSKKGDLDITSFTNLMIGGSSGSVIEPGDVDGSYLFDLVTHEDEPVMPPSGKIPDAEIEVIRKWIELGALENKGSKAVVKKVSGVAMGENPLVRPEVVATLPRMPIQPVQRTARNPVARAIATSPWAPMAAVAGKNQVLIYDTKSLQLIGVLPFPEGTVNVVKFSRSGAVLLAAGGRAGASGVAVLWDVATGERITTVGDELDEILAADISPDHGLVALGGSSRLINIYSVETGEKKHSIKKHTDWVTAMSFSTDGVLLATGDRNGGLHVWESWTAREYLTLKGHSGTIQSVAWRADSNVLASASKDTSIRLWELNNGSQIKTWNAHGGGANSVIFNREGQILSTGVDKTTKLWGQDGKQVIAFTAFKDVALSVAWCDETKRAIAGDYTGTICVWKPDGALQGLLSPNPRTLEQRLAASEKGLQQRTTALQPLVAAATAATEKATTAQTTVTQSTVAQTAAQKTFDSVQAAMVATSQQATTLKVQLDAGNKELAEFTSAKPLLDEALQKIQQASAKLPTDEPLKQQVVTLTQRVAALQTQIETKTTATAALQSKLTEITSQVVATDAKVKATTDALKAVQAKVVASQAALQPLVVARDAAVVARDQAQTALNAAKYQVDRWKNEIAFIAQLKQLQAQLDAANNVLAEKQTGLNAANDVLKTAHEKSNVAAKLVQDARTSAQQITDQIEAAKKIER